MSGPLEALSPRGKLAGRGGGGGPVALADLAGGPEPNLQPTGEERGPSAQLPTGQQGQGPRSSVPRHPELQPSRAGCSWASRPEVGRTCPAPNRRLPASLPLSSRKPGLQQQGLKTRRPLGADSTHSWCPLVGWVGVGAGRADEWVYESWLPVQAPASPPPTVEAHDLPVSVLVLLVKAAPWDWAPALTLETLSDLDPGWAGLCASVSSSVKGESNVAGSQSEPSALQTSAGRPIHSRRVCCPLGYGKSPALD